MKMKFKLLLSFTLAFLVTCGLISSVAALTISDVGSIDPLISVVNLGSSGAATEAAWINSVLGTNYDGDYVNDHKIEGLDEIEDLNTIFKPVEGGEEGQYAFDLPEENGYFLIKTGNGMANAPYSHWLFKNSPITFYGTFIIDYQYTALVYTFFTDIENFGVYGMDTVTFEVNDIESISHFAGIGPAPVPEPSTLLLLGAGLVGLGGWARRFKK